MKLCVLALLAASIPCIFVGVGPVSADEFEIMNDTYGSCFGQNRITDGVRYNCISSVSIFNSSNGSIYLCEAQFVFDVVGVDATSSVMSQTGVCNLKHKLSKSDVSNYSAGAKYDASLRQLPPGRPASGAPARFYWLTSKDGLKAKFCVDMVAYKGYSGCIDAPFKSQ